MTVQKNADDPLKLMAMLGRISELSSQHSVTSVVAGIYSETGNQLFPEFINFLESALRVEDAIFRMTRERAVVHLADIDKAAANEVLERIMLDFRAEFPTIDAAPFSIRLYEVESGTEELRAKVLLPALFAPLDS